MGLFRRWRRRQLSEEDQRRLAIQSIRENMRAMGFPQVDELTDEELEEMVTRFSDLASMAMISAPEAAAGLQQLAAAGVSAEDQLLTRDDVEDLRKIVEASGPKPGIRTHDEAGILLMLKGGPMDGYLIREGAPALQPDWSTKGRYVRAERDDDGNETARWDPA